MTKDEKKVDTLIAGLTALQYQTLKSLVFPEKPAAKSYAEVTEVLTQHFEGKRNPRSERCKFRGIIRNENESIQNFAVRLREAARHCMFGANLDENLIDQFLQGVKSPEAVKKILDDSKGLALSFQGAVDIALAVITSERSSSLYAPSQTSTSDVHWLRNAHTNESTVNPRDNSRPPSLSDQRRCFRCNSTTHLADKCRHKKTICHSCGREGHIAVACLQKRRKAPSHRNSQNTVEVEDIKEPQMGGEYNMYEIDSEQGQWKEGECLKILGEPDKTITVLIKLNGKPVNFGLDTGAVVSCIGEKKFEELCKDEIKLQETDLKLRDYNKKPIDVLGVAKVQVEYGEQSKELSLVVVRGERAPLFGRNWLREIRLDWKSILSLGQQMQTVSAEQSAVEEICSKYKEVFEPGLGCLKDFEANITVKQGTTPVYKKARAVPYHLRPLVEVELARLERNGVIKPVAHSEWASPIVPVVKSDGRNVRICADFKGTLNPASVMTQYPLPTPEDIFASLGTGESYTKLDLSSAYHQLKLSEESKKYMVINTHKGLFAYQRLQFGVHSAVGIFQRAMENVLKDIPYCAVYIDDVLLTGPTEEEHRETLGLVLQRLSDAGLKVNEGKCSFMQPEVNYLGHKLTSRGILPLESKIEAIHAFKTPRSKQELSTFCGMVKYYHRFLPNASQVMMPLYELEKKETKWHWSSKHEEAFKKIKGLLTSDTLLVRYNPSKELFLTCDASSYGLGAVLEQEVESGRLKPVSFASRTLTIHEKNYCQTEKEGLAVVWAVNKFSKYLYGRNFEVRTDHKPLLGLLGESKAVPLTASGRIIRWCLQLSAYNYKLVYKPGSKVTNADCLSRFPLQVACPEPPSVGEEVLLLEHLSYTCTTVCADDIRRWTDRDPIQSRVRSLILKGWREGECKSEPSLQPYYLKRNELSVLDGCLLWGSRVVVPPQGRDIVTEELHATHPGIVKMKNLARGYVWWPGIDRDLERKVQTCEECQSVRSFQSNHLAVHPWEYPSAPWSRIHIDYAGPFEGKMFLVIVDSHSKWLEVIPTMRCTAQITVTKLRSVFATHGIPDIIVSDNGTSFTGAEFQDFVTQNRIRHVTSAPYHPATNGLAENAVKTFKQAMKKTKGDLELRLCRFLFDYRITPHATTGVPPCELLFKRRIKSRFDLLKPSIEERVFNRQAAQVASHPMTKEVQLTPGEHVYTKNFSRYGPPNVSARVESQTGPVSGTVRTADGQLLRRHFSQLFKQLPPETVEDERDRKETKSNSCDITQEREKGESVVCQGEERQVEREEQEDLATSTPVLRRSGRIRNPVDRLGI